MSFVIQGHKCVRLDAKVCMYQKYYWSTIHSFWSKLLSRKRLYVINDHPIYLSQQYACEHLHAQRCQNNIIFTRWIISLWNKAIRKHFTMYDNRPSSKCRPMAAKNYLFSAAIGRLLLSMFFSKNTNKLNI